MALNQEITDLTPLTSPSGALGYFVKAGDNYSVAIGGNNGLAYLNGSGLVPTALLGTGTADGTTYLRGDGTWATVAGGGGGTVTSVGVANTTGISWTGGPITGSGTLTATLSANLQAWSAIAPSAKADASHTHHINDLTATGTKNSTTFLRGDNTWAVPPSGGGGGTGTVTSIGITPGTGVTSSGGPITSSGSITIGLNANLQSWSSIAPAAKADASHSHAASDITSGVMATARLGTGTANSGTFLRGDGTWQGVGGGGSVTSVNISGGTTGLTWSGGPITGAGTMTAGGTLAIANGGTGATSAAAARTALGVPATAHTHTTSDITDLSSYTGLDARYYTETETNSLLSAKAATSHTHTTTDITDLSSYTGLDGRYYTEAETNSLLSGKAASSHTHSAADITSGTLPVARGGTGGTTEATARAGIGIHVQASDPGGADGDIWIW